MYEVAGQTNYWAAWINGLMQPGSTNVNSYFIKPAPTLGANVYNGQYYFAGDIAEVPIFNRTLTTDGEQPLMAIWIQDIACIRGFRLSVQPTMPLLPPEISA